MLKLKYLNKMDNKQNGSVPTTLGLLGTEHKIGEIFEDEGKNLQCVESFGCKGCYYNDLYSSYQSKARIPTSYIGGMESLN